MFDIKLLYLIFYVFYMKLKNKQDQLCTLRL